MKNYFILINRRIMWLTDKIAWSQVNNRGHWHYIEERDALIWATDKIKELSEKLLGRIPEETIEVRDLNSEIRRLRIENDRLIRQVKKLGSGKRAA